MNYIRISVISVICALNLISFVIASKFDYRTPLPIRQEIDRFKSYQKRTNTSPCINLYEYSCGNYLRNVHNTYDGYSKNVPDLLLAKLENQVKNLLTESKSSNKSGRQKHAFEHKAIRFYKTCEQNILNNTRIHRQLTEIINELSPDAGWPIWKENWNSTKFYWFNVLARMKLYGITQVIDTRIAPFPQNTTGKNFVISCKPKFGYKKSEELKDQHYRHRYKDEIKKIFQEYGAKYQDAVKYAEDVVKFEMDLLHEISSRNTNNYSNEIYDDNDYEQYQYYKFKNDFWHVDWDRYLKLVFRYQVKETSLLLVIGTRCLKSILEFISYSHPTTVANYLFISIINDLQDLANPTSRPNFCIKAINNAMSPVISYMYLHHNFNEKAEIDVYNIWNSIKLSHLQIWKTYIEGDYPKYNYISNYNENYENDTVFSLNKKLENMRLVFFSDHIDILERVSYSYNQIDIDTTNFIRTYFRFINHNNKLDIPRDHVRYLILFSGLHIEPFYVYEKNALIIPPGILQEPYYHMEWPKLFKYSKLGFLISRNIAKAFDRYGRELDEFGNRHKWWMTNINITKFVEDNLRLIYNEYKLNTNLQNQETNNVQQLNEKIAINENWSDLFGLKAAFKAYYYELMGKTLSYNTIETAPNTGLSANQTFFVSYSQLFCGEYLPQYDRAKKINIPFELRVNMPLVFMDECKLAFECN